MSGCCVTDVSEKGAWMAFRIAKGILLHIDIDHQQYLPACIAGTCNCFSLGEDALRLEIAALDEVDPLIYPER